VLIAGRGRAPCCCALRNCRSVFIMAIIGAPIFLHMVVRRGIGGT
jgi:hypothetical protein